MKRYPNSSIPTDEILKLQAKTPRPPCFENHVSLPLEGLGDRLFEHLVRALFDAQIAAGEHRGRFDKAELMQGVGEQGRDIVLWFERVPAGIIQCKFSRDVSTKLSRPCIARELLKTLLYSCLDRDMLRESGAIYWYIATNAGLTDPARAFANQAGLWLLKNHAECDAWAEQVIQGNQRLTIAYDKVTKAALCSLLERVQSSHITGPLLSDLVKAHEEQIMPVFFKVKMVADATASNRMLAAADEMTKVTKQAANALLAKNSAAADNLASLATQVHDWLMSMGYTAEAGCNVGEDYCCWVVASQPVRRRVSRIMIRVVAGEASLLDLKRLRQDAKGANVDEAWLIAATRIASAAKNATRRELGGIKEWCLTLDDMIEMDIDFEPYFNWLDSEIFRLQIDSLWIPLGCHKPEVDPQTGSTVGVSEYSAKDDGLERYVDRWLCDPSKEHLSVLGEFGMGKTWFALHYAWRLAQRYRESKAAGLPRPRIPLYIPLRDYAKALTIESLFSELFFRKHATGLNRYQAFEQLNRMGKLLLIFDGFDEMAQQIDRQKMINNFWEIARTVVPGAKVLLTCRTEHFPEDSEGRNLLSAKLRSSTEHLVRESPRFELLHVTPFDDEQIEKALTLRAEPSVVDRILKSDELRELATRPLMAGLIIEALPDIQAGKAIDLPRVYLYAVRRKLERDVRSERTFTSMADKVFFMCEVASEMQAQEKLSLNYREFPERIRALFGEKVQRQHELDHWHYDMMAQNLLVRDEYGEYRPSHRSLLEFFLAYRFAAMLGMLADDFVDILREGLNTASHSYTWSEYFQPKQDTTLRRAIGAFEMESFEKMSKSLGGYVLTPAVYSMLRKMLSMADHEACSVLLSLVQESRSNDAVGYLPCNLISLMLALDPKSLRGADLSGTKLINSSFLSYRTRFSRDADLSNVNFEGADLRDANFHCSRLQGANFSKANLENIQIRTLQWDGASLYSPRSELVVSSHADISLWDVGASRLLARRDMKGAWEAKHSPDGRYVYVSGFGNFLVLDAVSLDTLCTYTNSVTEYDRCGEGRPNLWTHGFEFLDAAARTLILGCNNGAMYIWDMEEGVELYRIERHEGCVRDVVVSIDKSFAVSMSYKDIIAWDIVNGRGIREVSRVRWSEYGRDEWFGNGTFIGNFALDAKSELLAATMPGNFVRILEPRTLSLIREYDLKDSRPRGLMFMPDTQRLVVVCSDGILYVDVSTNEGPASLVRSGRYARVRRLAMHNGDLVIVGGDGYVFRIDSSTGVEKSVFAHFSSMEGTRFDSVERLDNELARLLAHYGVQL